MKNTGTLKVTTPTEREVLMTRVFDAPRRLVFDALTKPELFKRWFGPRGWSLAVCEIDLKVGGRLALRFAWPRWQGHGDARRLPGDRAARAPHQHRVLRRYPGESLNTLVLSEKDGKTTFTITVRYQSQENSRRGPSIRHGARRGRVLRQARWSCWRLRMLAGRRRGASES